MESEVDHEVKDSVSETEDFKVIEVVKEMELNSVIEKEKIM